MLRVRQGSLSLVGWLLLVACGQSEGSPAGAGAEGGSAGGGASAQGGGAGSASAGTAGAGAAWFEIVRPLPSPLLGPEVDPALVLNETEIEDASADGSVLVGSSWATVMLGIMGFGSDAFRFTRAGGVESLGYVPGAVPSEPYVLAQKVSRDGSVVFGSYGPGARGPFFRWTAETGMVPLDPGGDGPSLAFGEMSDDGKVIAGTSQRSTQEAVRWTEASGLVGLGFLPGHSSSSAVRISRDGRAIVGSSGTDSSSLYRWTEDLGMVSLELPGCFVPRGGVGEDGAVVMGQCLTSTGEVEVFAWTQAGGTEILGAIPGGTSFQSSVAVADRKLVVGQALIGHENSQPYRVSAASGVVALGALSGLPACFLLGASDGLSERSATSRDGSVVAGTCLTTSGTTPRRGFRWTEAAGLVALEPLDGHLETTVTSVSPDGIVAGVSRGSAGAECVIWNDRGEPLALRAELEDAGVELDGFSLDANIAVVEGGRIVYGSGHDRDGAGRAWVARRP